jgi:hypothetical protein
MPTQEQRRWQRGCKRLPMRCRNFWPLLCKHDSCTLPPAPAGQQEVTASRLSQLPMSFLSAGCSAVHYIRTWCNTSGPALVFAHQSNVLVPR